MKGIILGALVGAGLVIAAVGAREYPGEVFAQQLAPERAGGVRAGDQLIAVPCAANAQGQMLTVIDPRQQVMCVYRIDAATGKISLRSVRNIHWDLLMSVFDNEGLLPQEIRSQLEQR